MIFGEAVYAIACRHIPVIGAPEGQSIDQRLTQDDLFRDCQRLFIPDAFVRTGKIGVKRRPLAQAFGDLPPVDFRDVSIKIDHRDYKRTGKVFVAAFSDFAERCSRPGSLRLPYGSFRQSVTKRSIRKAQPEVVDHFRMFQTSVLQVFQSLGALFQAFRGNSPLLPAFNVA